MSDDIPETEQGIAITTALRRNMKIEQVLDNGGGSEVFTNPELPGLGFEWAAPMILCDGQHLADGGTTL